MFIVPKKETITREMTVRVETDNKILKPYTFKAIFKRLSKDELRRLLVRKSWNRVGVKRLDEHVAEGRLTEEEKTWIEEGGILTDDEIIKNYFLGWEGVHGEGETEDWPFTPEYIKEFLDVNPVASEIVDEFWDAQNYSREKNLKARQGTGRQ